MSKVLTVRVSKETANMVDILSSELSVDKSFVLRKALEIGLKELAIETAIEKVKKGEVSLWKAAELSGLSIWDFMEELRRRNVVIYALEDFMEDIKVVESGL